MMLSDVRDYVESLGISKNVYMGKLPDKPEKSIGVYNTAIGGSHLEGYGEKPVTILVHWNRSPRDTEKAATELFEKLRAARNTEINNETIKFIQPLYEIQDVGTDDAGIYEMVIEVAVIFEKKE